MKLSNSILISLHFICLLKNIQCLYIEKFTSHNVSSKTYSSDNPPEEVYDGKSVFNKNEHNSPVNAYGINNGTDVEPYFIIESIETVMNKQCGNTNFESSLHTCLSAFAATDRAHCIRCKKIKITKQFTWGISPVCRLEAECYNSRCQLVNSYLETYASWVKSYMRICDDGKIRHEHDCSRKAPLAEVCEDDYDDNFVDNFSITFKNNSSVEEEEPI